MGLDIQNREPVDDKLNKLLSNQKFEKFSKGKGVDFKAALKDLLFQKLANATRDELSKDKVHPKFKEDKDYFLKKLAGLDCDEKGNISVSWGSDIIIKEGKTPNPYTFKTFPEIRFNVHEVEKLAKAKQESERTEKEDETLESLKVADAKMAEMRKLKY